MSALIGAVSYLLVFRPLRDASTVANLVASTGLLAVIQALIVLQFGTAAIPVPKFLPEGSVRVAGASVAVDRLLAAGITVVVALALAAWFRWTRTGLALRATSENRLHVALAGWSPERLALVGWMLGSVLTAVLTILVAPMVSLSPIAFGLLIVPGLAAALIGRLTSVLATCAGGLGLGLITAEIGNWSTASWWPDWGRVGAAQLVPFLTVALVLVVRGSNLPFRGEPLGARLPKVSPRRPRLPVVLVGTTVGVVALLLTSGTYRFGLITSFTLAVLSLSIVVLTGYTGQLSLAPAAIAGIGGFAMAKLGAPVPFPFDVLLASVAACVAGVVICAPALRIRGAQLTIVTMAGAVALESLVFRNPSFTSQSGEMIDPVSFFGIDLSVRRGSDVARLPFGVMVLVVLVASCCVVACLTAGRTGRRFLAIRGDERAAAAAGIDVARTKLVASIVSSFLAGLAGALIGLARGQLTADSFTLLVGIAVVAYAAIGGITRVAGALLAGAIGTLGIMYVLLEKAIDFGKWYGLAAGVGLVLSVVFNPEGGAGRMQGDVERLLRLVRRRRGAASASSGAGEPERRVIAPSFAAPAKVPTLTVSDLRVAYGGVVAVTGVSFEVRGGEVLGLVGPNGAGKTSLLDGICGFAPSTGQVVLDGRRIDGLPPHRRQHAGIGRSWQDGGLFDDLSVLDNLVVAAEPTRAGDVVRDLVASTGLHREELIEVLASWGLSELADRRPTELSVGRRKLVDLARATAAAPVVLLADEPAAGLDSWESAALADRLRAYADSGRAVVLIEHDLTVVRAVCDRIIVLDFGAAIAEGEPTEVLDDPAVARAYLGVFQDAAPGATSAVSAPPLARGARP
jgi:ABC-type branched-subunit amino acid transport system ATPase component/ABC-type branched-subunit amino acid transport system permease subunit